MVKFITRTVMEFLVKLLGSATSALETHISRSSYHETYVCSKVIRESFRSPHQTIRKTKSMQQPLHSQRSPNTQIQADAHAFAGERTGI